MYIFFIYKKYNRSNVIFCMLKNVIFYQKSSKIDQIPDIYDRILKALKKKLNPFKIYYLINFFKSMQRKKTITLAFIAFFSAMSLNAFCQQTINVSSHSAAINGLKFDYSIGEMTLVTTERNAGIIVTQGLLQPNGSGSRTQSQPGNTSISASDLIKVYPNPTENILFVESNENADADISYQLFDAAGKMVLHEKIIWTAGPNKLSLDLKNYAAGAYYLMIHKQYAQGIPENFSYKIQKTN